MQRQEWLPRVSSLGRRLTCAHTHTHTHTHPRFCLYACMTCLYHYPNNGVCQLCNWVVSLVLCILWTYITLWISAVILQSTSLDLPLDRRLLNRIGDKGQGALCLKIQETLGETKSGQRMAIHVVLFRYCVRWWRIGRQYDIMDSR